MDKIKNILVNFSVLCFTLILFLFFFEIGVRLFSYEGRKIVALDPDIGAIRQKNSTFLQVLSRQNIVYKTNTLGFVDTEHDFPKPKNTIRILILGDSYTEALQVDFEKNFHQLLEQKFNTKVEGKGFEVVVFGMSGFNTAQEYLVYKKYGEKFDPDIVMVMFTLGNDISGNNPALFSSKTKAFFNIKEGRLIQTQFPSDYKKSLLKTILTDYLELPRFIFNKAKNNPIFLRFASEDIKDIDTENNTPKDAFASDNGLLLSLKDPSSEWQKAWEITLALLKNLGTEAQNNGSKFLLVSIPTTAQLFPELVSKAIQSSGKDEKDYDIHIPEDRLKKISEENNFFFLSLTETLKPLGDKIGEPDGHFGYQAHEIVADTLLEFITKNLKP